MADKKQPQNVVFKKKATTFSMIANPIIDDKTITPAAGWLYVLIQRWITYNDPNFSCSKSFIASRFRSGSYMFNRAWDELKTAGYLKMYSHPTEGWQADLLDEAQPDTPHTFYLDLNGEVKSTNVDRAAKKAEKHANLAETDHYPENHSNGTHYPENHSNGKHDIGEHSNGNDGNKINTSLNTFFNTFNNTIYQSEVGQAANNPVGIEQKDRLIDDALIEEIKEQIDYDILLETPEFEYSKSDLDAAVDAMAVLKTVNTIMKIGAGTYTPDNIRARVNEIDSEHIKYVFQCIREKDERIYNLKQYLLTAIFNAPTTIEVYYDNLVNANRASSFKKANRGYF